MKKICLSAMLIAMFFSLAFSYKVDVAELKDSKKIDFINYSGKRYEPASPRQRIGIGRELADISVSDNIMYTRLSFSIFHAVDPADTNGMDADIFSILPDARIDHINSVRLIISSYLSRRYGYSPDNAMTVAVFVTYYNAVHRNDTVYFSSRYKKNVIDKIAGADSGIDVLYSLWPGRTRMLIPLTDDIKKGEAKLLDTGEITTPEVIDMLKNREDKGINERKKINEIEKKEIEEAKTNIQEKKAEIARKTEAISEQEKKTSEKKTELEAKKQSFNASENDLAKQKQEVQGVTDKNEKAAKEKQIARTEKEIEKKKTEIQNTEKQVAKEENKTAEQKEALNREQKKVAKIEENTARKEETASKETGEIKKDETAIASSTNTNSTAAAMQEISNKSAELDRKALELSQREAELKKAAPDKSIFEGRLYYLKIKQYIPQGHYNNEMNIINPITKKIEITSPFKDICGHRFDVFKEGVVVIGYSSDDHASDHFLVLLDNTNLLPKYQGKDNIFWRSFIEIRDDYIYAIIFNHFAYYLGKFNDKLEKVAQSASMIDSDTIISFYGDSIYVNDSDKKIIVLGKDDLAQLDVINP
jgi:hypothetical protein